ncbi:hypothetical protein [uncultured Chryseobacterium sp.]|uniref:hypothetical protein n=1 Tax=uncultured Chryseobacterium sp. TaxID=259322 RepID=UPI00258B153F|nr:hypothetical protein [uncultured Chryseobacterium sp.]
MEFLETKEKLKILLSISDQLWDDYKSGLIKADEYLQKADDIREELNNIDEVTFGDMQHLSKCFGYFLFKSDGIFNIDRNYKFQRLIFN